MSESADDAATIARRGAMPEQDVTASDEPGDFPKRRLINTQLLDQVGDPAGRRVLDAGAGERYPNAILGAGCRTAAVLEPGLDPEVAARSGISGIEGCVQLPNLVIIAADRNGETA